MITLLLSLIIGVNIGDTLSTVKALQNPKVHETSPTIRKIGLIPAKVIGTIIQCGCVWVLFHSFNSLAFLLTGIITAFYSWIIIHNIKAAKV